jgi:putative oxidoreductase
MCINHGFGKVTNFNELSQTFFDPFHIGHKWSLMLSIFAELFAAMLLVLGLFSRIAALILVINMAVAVYMLRHAGLKQSEDAIIYLAGFFILLLIGPGKYSVDGMSGK